MRKEKNSNLVLMILVTGGTGLVGSHLLYKLTENEQVIRATYRSDSKLNTVKHIFSYYSNDYEKRFNSIEWIKTDITDIPKLTTAFSDVTHVYHCAALVSFNPKDYHKLRHVNIEGTANIVNLCIANGIKKLCYVSSIATIGDPKNDGNITENCDWNKENDHHDYAISKYGAEMEVWRGTQEGVDAVIVNPGIIIGPGFWNSSSTNLFKKVYKGISFYTNAINGYVAIFDVVEAMIKLYNSNTKNERFIVVSENLSLKSFLTQTANNLGVNPPKKEASKLMLGIAWRLDWLRCFIFSKDRKITKHLVNSLYSNRNYSSEKLLKTIDLNFTPVADSIALTSRLFLNDSPS